VEYNSISLNCAGKSYTVGRYAHYCIGEGGELGDFDRLGVGDKYNVFIAHLDSGCEEIASRIAKVRAVHDRYSRPDFRTVDPERLGELNGIA
jgi:hypothetical protein